MLNIFRRSPKNKTSAPASPTNQRTAEEMNAELLSNLEHDGFAGSFTPPTPVSARRDSSASTIEGSRDSNDTQKSSPRARNRQ